MTTSGITVHDTMGGLPERVARALQRWRRPLATTAQGVELALALTYAGLRLILVVLICCGLVGALIDSASRPTEIAAVVVYITASAIIAYAGIRRGFIRVPAWAWADVAIGVGVLLAMVSFVPDGHAADPWDAWGYAATISCAAYAGITLRHAWDRTFACLALMAAYIWSSWHITDDNLLFTVLPNALAYPGFLLLARYFSIYLLRLGADADAARAAIEQVTREAVHAKTQLLLHDKATILKLIGDGVGDELMKDTLRRQAATAAQEIRAFLASESAKSTRPPEARTDLAEVVQEIAGEFPDLAPTVSVDLARGVSLPFRQSKVVGAALSTLLHNVRRHAAAEATVIHADSDDDTWELTVRDDGVGFDPAVTPRGFGLETQVIAACRSVGVHVALTSAPGDGTHVVLRGRRATPDNRG